MDTGEILRTVLNHEAPNVSLPQMVFHHIFVGPTRPDIDIVNSVNSWLINDWGPAWAPLASNQYEINDFQCDVVNPDGTVARNLGGLGVNINGTDSNAFGGAAVSGYLLAYTDKPKQRGSKYVPGISEAKYDSNRFTPGALTELALLLGIYLLGIDVGGSPELVAGVLSRTLVAFEQFNGNGLINAQPAYQRRRKDGVGA